MNSSILEQVVYFMILVVAAGVGVITNRAAKGMILWTKLTIVYTLLAAILTFLLVKWMGVAP